jgi:hypothetical protein
MNVTHSAKCHSAEWGSVMCRSAQHCSAECRPFKCRSVACRGTAGLRTVDVLFSKPGGGYSQTQFYTILIVGGCLS